MILTVTLNPAMDKTLRVPNFAVGQHARARLLSLIPAGKGINVARGLARLGRSSTACGLVGRGERETYRRVLENEGIDCALTDIEGITRTNTTILDPERGTTTHLREEGFTVTEEDLHRLSDALCARLKSASAPARVVFAGSLPPGVNASQFVRILEGCHEAGARIVLDTSGPPLRAAVASGLVDTVKPNLTELGQCLGREVGQGECVEAARGLLDRADAVLLTLGERGAWLVGRDVRAGARCPLMLREVQNTVGCGDAFLAGWLDGMDAGRPAADALGWAASAGAASARGKTTVDYTRQDVEELMGRCEELRDSE